MSEVCHGFETSSDRVEEVLVVLTPRSTVVEAWKHNRHRDQGNDVQNGQRIGAMTVRMVLKPILKLREENEHTHWMSSPCSDRAVGWW